MSLGFETDENGRPIPNTWVPCSGCGAMVGFVTNDPQGLATNPLIVRYCHGCAIVAEAESYTADAPDEKRSQGDG